MSYLDFPRLSFAGRFQADVSTVNNIPQNFDDATFTPAKQQPGNDLGGWNPRGSGAWRFLDCAVQSVTYNDGSVATTPAEDPIVGAPVGGARARTSAKLVDLDPQQQMVSQIWGMRITLGQPEAPPLLEGDFRVAAFRDIWARCPSVGPDSMFGAFFQSVLENLAWSPSTSRFLREMQVAGVTRLSIKFNVDGFQDDDSRGGFTYGRVVGTIGPARDDEPAHFVNGRVLRSNYANPYAGNPLNDAYAVVDDARSLLVLDWGNSIPTAAPGGGPLPLGRIELQVGAGSNILALGTLDVSLPAYLRSGGVTSFPLTPEQLQAVHAGPLRLVTGLPGGQPLAENADGLSVRADQFVFRLSPGETAPVSIWANRFGRPAGGVRVTLGYYDAMISDPNLATATPRSAFTFPATVLTDEKGRATAMLRAADPGNPRGYIDGQVYGVDLLWGSPPDPAFQHNPTDFVSALVWDAYAAPAQPAWEDVQPIFQQYCNLYPVMSRIVDLSDLQNVQAHRNILLLAFALPVEDANSMPVTRDLSPAKRAMILAWLRAGAGLPPVPPAAEILPEVR